MFDALLHLIVLVTAVWGFYKGYRSGFTGQVASILGFAFGAVAAHAFGNSVADSLPEFWPALNEMAAGSFLASLFGYAIVFGIAYGLFALLGTLLRSLMKLFYVDVLNSAAGAIFCAFKYLFFLSLVYNVAGGLFPHSRLMKYAHADDGNLVQIVMLLGPGVMGCLDCDDLHHQIQLQDARTIS